MKYLYSITLIFLAVQILLPQANLYQGNLAIEPGFAVSQNIKQESVLALANSMVIASNMPDMNALEPVKYGVRRIIATAYSSTPDQTDASPFITASGAYVREGTVACNFLRFGTKVKFPEIYGDQIFTVEDRMHPRNYYKVDVWMESREQAKQFGVKRLKMIVLQ